MCDTRAQDLFQLPGDLLPLRSGKEGPECLIQVPQHQLNVLLGVFAGASLLLLLIGDRLPTAGLRGVGAFMFAPFDRVVLVIDRVASAWRENQGLHARGLHATQLLGTFFDGIARHTKEGYAFQAKAAAEGFKAAVRERDEPYGDA